MLHQALLAGVTIVAKNDYCDSIDITGSAIAIQLLLWTTIAMLLRYYCLKHLCLFEGGNQDNGRTFLYVYGYQFCIEPTKKRMLSKSTNLAEMQRMQNMYILLPFNFIFVPKPSNFE